MELQNTSIIVRKDIRKQLQIIKQEKDLKSVNEVIEDLIASSQAPQSKIPKNLKVFGENKK